VSLAAALSGTPRLLAGLRSDGPVSLAEHLDRFGTPSWSNSTNGELIDSIERSGLRGRGGAGFPVAVKMHAVAASEGRAIVVANGAEGEPASEKDRLLLEATPHLILDGAALAAAALDATHALICVTSNAPTALESVTAALAERERANLDPVELRIVEVSEAYVAGEESALVNELNGGPAKPTFVPPRPFVRGVGGMPTLIQNVETLAHLAFVARFGPDWFRELGTTEDPGTQLVTLSGSVRSPGCYEVPCGGSLTDLLEAAGGTSDPVQAFLVGGYSGTWFAGGVAPDLHLSHSCLRSLGTSLGPGVVIALPVGACAVAETARVLRFLADESAGQCGPCVFGLDTVAEELEDIAAGVARPQGAERIARWNKEIAGRGACHHPNGALRLVMSCLKTFRADISRHEGGSPCATEPAMRDLLPLPPYYTEAA
jgi:NADH:ubiquinone oxidoreductase subunit F (NADH-binding)